MDHFPERAKKHIDVHQKRNHDTRRDCIRLNEFVAVPYEKTQPNGEDNFQDGEEDRKIPIRTNVCVAVFAIRVLKLRHFLFLASEILDNGHAANMFLQKCVEVRYPSAYIHESRFH